MSLYLEFNFIKHTYLGTLYSIYLSIKIIYIILTEAYLERNNGRGHKNTPNMYSHTNIQLYQLCF